MDKTRDPYSTAFSKLKFRAKERGHAFTLTLTDYKELVDSFSYMAGRGKTGGALSLDRIDNLRGYERGNLRVITLAENSRRRFVPGLGLPREVVDQYRGAQ